MTRRRAEGARKGRSAAFPRAAGREVGPARPCGPRLGRPRSGPERQEKPAPDSATFETAAAHARPLDPRRLGACPKPIPGPRWACPKAGVWLPVLLRILGAHRVPRVEAIQGEHSLRRDKRMLTAGSIRRRRDRRLRLLEHARPRFFPQRRVGHPGCRPYALTLARRYEQGGAGSYQA